MTYPKISLLLLIFSLLIFSGCGKNDEDSDPITPDGFMVNSIAGDEGCNFDIKTNGVTESCVSDNVFGWESGNLLDSRRWKQIRTGCSGNYFVFRISMPPGTVFQDIAIAEHSLFQTRLLLQNSPDIDVYYPEFYFDSYDPEIPGNGSGTVEIRRDVVILGTTYSLVGNVDATFYNNAGNPVTVKGQFWSKDAMW